MSKTVLFVCRGNAFRSILADAYLKSKRLPDIDVLSAGTVADEHYAQNTVLFKDIPDLLARHGVGEFMKTQWGERLTQATVDCADVVIMLNSAVQAEAKEIGIRLPLNTIVWNVTDIGESGRTPKNKQEDLRFKEDAYKEICTNVDKLIKSNLK